MRGHYYVFVDRRCGDDVMAVKPVPVWFVIDSSKYIQLVRLVILTGQSIASATDSIYRGRSKTLLGRAQ